MIKECIVCKIKFNFKDFPCYQNTNTGKFCSRKCVSLFQKNQIICTCKKCGKTFSVNKARQKTAKFCSYSCRAKYYTGKDAPHFGKKHTKKAKEKMMKASFKGGRNINKKGYVSIYMPDHPFSVHKYIREHRFIVEQIINKYLKRTDEVHHINEITNDNRPENLIAFKSMSAHMRFHKNPLNVKNEEIVFDGRYYVHN